VLLSLKEGVTLPREASNALEALEAQRLLQVRHLPAAPPGVISRIWAKAQLWTLREYELVLYLDADTLVVGNVSPLFRRAAAGDARLSFAAALTRSMSAVNAGVMLLLA